jgi:hypothetical protein
VIGDFKMEIPGRRGTKISPSIVIEKYDGARRPLIINGEEQGSFKFSGCSGCMLLTS